MSTPANFNGAKPIIDPANAAMLLIDHQSGLFQTIQDMPFTEVRTNATTLAKVASLAKIPVITSASVPQGPNGPLIPEIHKYAPHAQYVARRGEINAWDTPEFVAAVKATGRKQLIIAGTIIGIFLEKSGEAFRLATSILRITGERNAPLAMSIMGYVISIPVFCDSGFVILSALNKAVARKAGISLAATAIPVSPRASQPGRRAANSVETQRSKVGVPICRP